MAIKGLAVAYNGTANSHAALRLAVRMADKYDLEALRQHKTRHPGHGCL